MLVLISPPSTELEEKKIWLGNANSPLSESGRQMAEEFYYYDAWIKPNRLYISSAEHIVEFSNIVFPDFPAIVLPELDDRSMGSLTGRPYKETMDEFPRRNWLSWQRSYWTASPDGESLFDISDRVLTAFRSKILPIEDNETVIVICAKDVMRLLIGFVTRTEETEIPKISVEVSIPYIINGSVVSPS